MDIENSLQKVKNSFSSQGNPRSESTYNMYEEYLDTFNKKPSYFEFCDDSSTDIDYFDFKKFEENLTKHFTIKILYKSCTHNFKETILDRICYLIYHGYDNHVMLDIKVNLAKNIFSNEELFKLKINNKTEIIDSNYCLLDSNPNENIIKTLSDCFKKSKINIGIKRVSIEMVSVCNSSFYAEDFYLKDDFVNFSYPEEHYGEGFLEFHEKLVNKLYTNNKGLILFHGDPGTGKTQYIRKLIQDLSENARVLYFSPSMISSVTNPEFIDFITNWSKETEDEKKRIIILEDAEPLLKSRNQNSEIGITNLLNLTSGLLSDILRIQYICTFNTNIKDIDQALLREERLTAIKQFKMLNDKQCKKLAEIIGIEGYEIENLFRLKKRRELSLAEIYTIKNKNEIIKHGIDMEPGRIGFRG